MAAESNTIEKTDVARVRMVDFNYQFTGNINKFMEILGVTRKIAVQEGTVLKGLKVTGALVSGTVAEGELIPLSHYSTQEVPMGEATLNKWRKGTTAEAILKGGYEQAVGATTDKLVKDVQKKIRGDLFTFMATGTGTASGNTLQSALAMVGANFRFFLRTMRLKPFISLIPPMLLIISEPHRLLCRPHLDLTILRTSLVLEL